ncbi:unnamed protein product [Echinostoma caproni]|uniref:RING-type domain-containing protein n=1 Tax=Echinostoma caproni TaxID=27848 RepID=A0A183B2D8_9TREM|nr:unnamed protein product [Echinostoma caproni]
MAIVKSSVAPLGFEPTHRRRLRFVRSYMPVGECHMPLHFYHKKCIDPWLLEQRSCPLCKLDILKSCGIIVGLSAEDESYLATRLVERDADSSSTSSSSVSAVSYPMGWRIRRLLSSILGKPTDPRCEACSLAYFQVMQFDALRYGGAAPAQSSQSTDRLCSYHAAVIGVPNVYRTPQTIHWTRYASHYATMRHYWNDIWSKAVQFPQSSARPSRWRQRFGFKRREVTGSSSTEKQLGDSMRTGEGSGHGISTDKRCPTQSSPTEPLVLNELEQPVLIHHSAIDTMRNTHHISPVTATTTTNTNIASRHAFPTVVKLDECQRLSALPPISVVGPQSSSSSDGSSEPSLVILPPSSIPSYINPLDRFWSSWYSSTAHIPPPAYLESLSQSWCEMTMRSDPTNHIRPHCKIRSRKLRGGYHPYFLPRIGRRRPGHQRSDFKEWLNAYVC